MSLKKYLKISRPGLWFPTIWIYMVPLGNQSGFWNSPDFWLGLLFVSFPLNFLVYGLNDYNDFYADSFNQRKGNFLFGARLSKKEMVFVPRAILIVISPFIIYFIWKCGLEMLVLLGAMILVNIIYNFKPFRIKERPPLEILIQCGYVLTAYFSIELNELNLLPWQTTIYLCLFAFQAHIAGEIMDIEPDMQAGKRTTATLIKRKNSKLLMLLLLLVECYILVFWFQDWILASFLLLFSTWLILDIFILFKNKPYTLIQMKVFGYGMNLIGFLSMLWIVYSGKLLTPVN